MPPLAQAKVYWDGRGTPTQAGIMPATKLQTVTPLTRDEYVKLLNSKPVNDWDKLTQFLVSHHLVVLPAPHLFPEVPGYSSAKVYRTQIQGEDSAHRKAMHARRQLAQQAAKLARDRNKLEAHKKRMEEQKRASEARAARKTAHVASLQAAQLKRLTAATEAKDLMAIKTGADAKRFLETRIGEVMNQAGASLNQLREGERRLTPVRFSRLEVRPIRAHVELSSLLGATGEISTATTNAWRTLQDVLRMVERHLSYLFHEGNGWTVVSRRRHKRGRTAAKSTTAITGGTEAAAQR